MRGWFQRFAHRTADAAGSIWAFIGATLVVLSWLISGPIFGFSQGWSLAINTVTTIVTFEMVFLLQATQSRDTEEIKAMLRELIHVDDRADDQVAEPHEEGKC